MKKIRVRYAPSPTGFLHIGGARTALFNYLFARHHHGDFIVRIEDTDIERNIEKGEASQLDNLRWLGIIPDETTDIGGPYAPYRQTERLDIYLSYANQLIESGYAYKCFCTSEELEKEKESQELYSGYSGKCSHLSEEEILNNKDKPFAIRLKIPNNKSYEINDIVRGNVVFESEDISDWVILKQNGIPTYNFAVVIDDHLMEISHVFRGEEHLSNTPKQMMLYDYFNWEIPEFGHMTLIVNEERKKLSKRDESIMQFISQYKDLGYLPEAMFNFFALLGWSPEGENEIFSHDELIELFDVSRLSKSPSMFDVNKMKWTNNRYIKELSKEEVFDHCLPFLNESYDLSNVDEDWLKQLVSLYHHQISFFKEIVDVSKVFFKDDKSLSAESLEIIESVDSKKVLDEFKNQINLLEFIDEENIKVAINNVKDITGIKGKNLFMPIRIATTFEMHGPELGVSLKLLGKDKILSRLV